MGFWSSQFTILLIIVPNYDNQQYSRINNNSHNDDGDDDHHRQYRQHRLCPSRVLTRSCASSSSKAFGAWTRPWQPFGWHAKRAGCYDVMDVHPTMVSQMWYCHVLAQPQISHSNLTAIMGLSFLKRKVRSWKMILPLEYDQNCLAHRFVGETQLAWRQNSHWSQSSYVVLALQPLRDTLLFDYGKTD